MSEPAKQAGGLSNLAFRLLTAAVLVPVILLLVAWQNHLGFWVFVLLCTVAGLYEFLGMTAGDADWVDRTVVLIIGTGFAVALYWWPAHALQLLGGAVTLTMIYAVFRESWQLRAQPKERDHRLLGNIFLATFAGIMTFSLTSNVVLDETFWTFISLVAIASCLYFSAEEKVVAEPLEAEDKDLLVVILPRP